MSFIIAAVVYRPYIYCKVKYKIYQVKHIVLTVKYRRDPLKVKHQIHIAS